MYARRVQSSVRIDPETKLYMPLDKPIVDTVASKLVQDRSANNNHGVFGSGNVMAYPGMRFDGTINSNIILTNQDLGDPQTFSVWFKPVSVAGLDILIVLEGVADMFSVSTGTLTATSLVNAETMYVNGVASTTVVAGFFQMLTMTLDAAESAGQVVIGRKSAPGPAYCNGILGDIFVSDGELSAVEVLNLFNRTRRRYGI